MEGFCPVLIGSPKAVSVWNEYFIYLTSTHNFYPKVALEGVSRGGLYVYNFAKRYPERISCIYAEAPVCDFKSWPGGFTGGKRSDPDWKLLLEMYGFRATSPTSSSTTPTNLPPPH